MALAAWGATPKVEIINPNNGIDGKLTKVALININFTGFINKLDWSYQSTRQYDKKKVDQDKSNQFNISKNGLNPDQKKPTIRFNLDDQKDTDNQNNKMSTDYEFLIINSTNEEMSFISIETYKEIIPSKAKDILWSTNCCVFSFGTHGLNEQLELDSDITGCATDKNRNIL